MDDEVLVVKWGQKQADVSTRNHISVLVASSVLNDMTIETPKYRLKAVYLHCKKYVSVDIRSYIKGRTLKSVYNTLSDDDIDAIFIQIQAVVWLLARKESEYFGHICYGQLRTCTPIAYIRLCAFVDKAQKILNYDDWIESKLDNYDGKAVFCHKNLSPEHIILDGTNVVGILGWSDADFMPEVYERLTYYFRSDPKNPRCWFRKLSDISVCLATGKPSVEFVIDVVRYVYRRVWNTSDVDNKVRVNKLWNSITTNYTQLNCLSQAQEVQSDNMSLSSLTGWTDYTEETLIS